MADTLFLLSSVSVVSDSFAIPWTISTWLRCPWNFPGKNNGVGCHFLTQGSNPQLPLCRWVLYL